MDKCTNCEGCGRVASGDEGASWISWMEIPVQSALAVTTGTVYPIQCPDCLGIGYPILKPIAEMLQAMGFMYNTKRLLFEPGEEGVQGVTPEFIETIGKKLIEGVSGG